MLVGLGLVGDKGSQSTLSVWVWLVFTRDEYLSHWRLRALQWRQPHIEPFITNMFDISDSISGRLRLSQEQ